MAARPAHLIVLVLLALVAGCDGYARVLYLKPPGASKPPWSVASVVIPVAGDEDVAGIVSSVAADLGLTRDLTQEAGSASWSLRDRGGGGGRGSFTITLEKEAAGYWTVVLMDWPSFARSDHSIRAERAIRTALKTGRPERTPIR